MLTDMMTIKPLLRQVLQQSFAQYPQLSTADIKHWLAHCIQQPSSFFISHDDYLLTPAELTQFTDGLAVLAKGKPLALLTGTQPFWSLEFMVNEHTLIPRPDTEVLVETVLTQLQQDHAIDTKGRLLDLGTGTGCIAISLAYELKSWQITAVDKSVQALAVARQNGKHNQVVVEFLTSDWFAALQGRRFEVIVANPPYIAPDDTHLAALTDEPITALVSTNEGLADIEHIVANASDYLVATGLLLIEHGYNQAEVVQQLFSQAKFTDITTIKDYGHNDRITMGRASNK